jgi:Bacterial extracellular solute-binding proteins, family 5 Middle
VEKTPAEYIRKPVSAGPLMLAEWTPGTDLLVLKANPNYWAKPHVQELHVVVIPDATSRLLALQQGAGDYVYTQSQGEARRADWLCANSWNGMSAAACASTTRVPTVSESSGCCRPAGLVWRVCRSISSRRSAKRDAMHLYLMRHGIAYERHEWSGGRFASAYKGRHRAHPCGGQSTRMAGWTSPRSGPARSGARARRPRSSPRS